MSKPISQYIHALMSLIIMGCSTHIVDPEDEFLDSLIAIDSRITIYFSEVLKPEERILLFDFMSERSYPNPGYYFYLRTSADSNSIHIEFLGIQDLGAGEQVFAAARGSYNAGAIPNGSYDLFFYLNDEVEQMSLDVSEEAYTLTLQPSEWFRCPHPVLGRIPEGTIWGTAEYRDAQYSSQIGTFIDTLETVGAEEIVLNPGFYGAFRIDSTGAILPYGRAPEYGQAFCYHYEGDWNVLTDILRYYASISDNQVRIWINGTEGQDLRSWLLYSDP